jgi:hypothetical protein
VAWEIKTLASSANKIGTIFDSNIVGRSLLYIINMESSCYYAELALADDDKDDIQA